MTQETRNKSNNHNSFEVKFHKKEDIKTYKIPSFSSFHINKEKGRIMNR